MLFRTSLQFGITCLKRVNFDRSQLEERRRIAELETVDILVWSNERVIKWITSIGLKVYQLLTIKYLTLCFIVMLYITNKT